ncbi:MULTISPECIES: CoA ester lyase [unclassified Rhodococcus (in: high G+C Gram-positive bacteria)]|uniref:HpcH/HpaI aldolase/citrate lyase family protein n=1 Tax=unclassified Rhodococcus (in: high G+C Gram-positive bacteria) TaxID=192944 RepID=UPI0021C03AE5|nr:MULTISPECIES: CoA ester lyase [unclassified Rhodococcus (in: high G+C Gram-positive bacteria)]
MTDPVPRSFLYVPAVKPELFDKAAGGDADAIIVDLEDAVPLALKDAARRDVRAWLDKRIATRAEVWVRVTPEFLDQDLEVAASAAVDGVVIAKCSVDALARAETVLDELETARGLRPLGLIGLIETAASLRSIDGMAKFQRVRTFGIGEVDLLADLRITRTADTTGVIDALRLQVVIDCAAAGLAAPIAPTSTDFRDLDGFAATTTRFVEMGFRGRTALHPRQIPIINDALTPSNEDVTRAHRLLELYRLADGGPTVDDNGRFVDEAVVRGAREILARV